MSYPPIYVINLKRTPERKLHIQRELDALNLSYQFVEAIDRHDMHCPDYRRTLARQIDIDENVITLIYKNLDIGTVACALSHIKVYNLMIENNISVACILEDDGYLLPTFPDVLAASKEVSWDVLMFSHQSAIIRNILGTFYSKSWYIALFKLILYKIFHPQLNLYIVSSILRHVSKYNTLRSSNESLRLIFKYKGEMQYHGCKVGALPSRDRSSWYKSTSDHYIAKPERIKGNCPTSFMGYMLTRSAAIKCKREFTSRLYPTAIDMMPCHLYWMGKLNLYIVIPPCITSKIDYLFYSAIRK